MRLLPDQQQVYYRCKQHVNMEQRSRRSTVDILAKQQKVLQQGIHDDALSLFS